MSQQLQYKIRALTAADQPLLWEMLYLSLFVLPGGSGGSPEDENSLTMRKLLKPDQ